MILDKYNIGGRISFADPFRIALFKCYSTLRVPGLFICSLRQINLPRFQIKMPRITCEAFVARSGFEPEHTEPESVVLPLYYQAKTEMAFRGARYIIIASESLLLQSLAAQ